MKTLSIDLETFSSNDIKKYGAHKYVDSDDFEIILFGYAFDDGPVQVVDVLSGEKIPGKVILALTDPEITKTAYNAAFERLCLAKHFGEPMPARQWSCTMAMGLYNGLPGGLDMMARAMHLNLNKDVSGKGLIGYWCVPCKPTKKNGYRTRNLPHHNPESWAQFKAYCGQDVRVERHARKFLRPLPSWEQRLWEIDQDMNDKGIPVDMELVLNAVECFDAYEMRLLKEARLLTNLSNPNSIKQLKAWLEEELDLEEGEIVSLNKAKVKEILGTTDDFVVQRVLEIRQEVGKSSVKKFHMLKNAVCRDGRIHGTLQYYGANRTGRYAGRLLQIQNLAKNYMKDLDTARRCIKQGMFDEAEMMWERVPDVLSQLIRTALVAEPGKTLNVCDFSAIEARVLAYLADEGWRMEVFRTHGKIYEASASAMFKIPLEAIGKDSPYRQKGKVAELGCGYGGGPHALESMDAKWAATQTPEQLRELIDAWRAASPNIVRFWSTVEQAAKQSIREQKTVKLTHGFSFDYRNGHLIMRYPTGRETVYREAKLEWKKKFGKDKECITFWGVDQKKKIWCKLETYGGRLVENMCQGFARDCLAVGLTRLDKAGYDILFHVHDEIVAMGQPEELDLMGDIMAQAISWAPGLPLPADGYSTSYYLKE